MRMPEDDADDTDVAARVAACVLTLCAARAPDGSICPSEVARALWPQDWRGRMPTVRSVAQELARSGRIEITQRGVPVDPTTLRGAVRLRLPRSAQ
jgi:hypothetical protein